MTNRIWRFGDDVDTDQIVPGRYAPYMRPGEDVGQFAFVETRPDFASDARPGDVIVAGRNFGCGSSREYAVDALRRRRVGAIVARGFARIFFRNAVNLGVPLFVSEEIPAAVEDGDAVALDLGRGVLYRFPTRSLPLPVLSREGDTPYDPVPGAGATGSDVRRDRSTQTGSPLTSGGVAYPLPPMPDFVADIVRAGGIVAYVREHGRFPGMPDGVLK